MSTITAQGDKIDQFENELEGLINKYSLENESGTPDFLLAEYLVDCLMSYNSISSQNKRWHTASPDEITS